MAGTGDVARGAEAVRRAADAHPGWLVLLDRLSPEFAPAGDVVRQALGRSYSLTRSRVGVFRLNTRLVNRGLSTA